MQPAIQPKETTTMKKQLWILVTAVAVMFTLAHAQAAIVTNGSFEQTPIPTYTSDQQPGWYSNGGSGGNVQFGTASTWNVQGTETPFTASQGTQIAIVNGSDYGAVLKTADADVFSLTANQKYTFSFDTRLLSAYNADWSAGIAPDSSMGLVVALQHNEFSEPVVTYYAATTVVDNLYAWNSTAFTFTPTADDSSVRVFVYSFSGNNVDSHVYTAIDNVQLTAVPEPASLALLGLSAVMLLRRRR